MNPSFEEYVHARGPTLLRLAYVLCGDHHLAQDLVQEAMAKVHRRWSRIEADNPDGYVRQALVRTHLSWWRRRSNRELPIAHAPDAPSGNDFASRHAARDELWALLAGLTKAQRAVLVLRFYEDLDDARIAELLGCRETTVRVHAHRALLALRSRISSTHPNLGAVHASRH